MAEYGGRSQGATVRFTGASDTERFRPGRSLRNSVGRVSLAQPTQRSNRDYMDTLERKVEAQSGSQIAKGTRVKRIVPSGVFASSEYYASCRAEPTRGQPSY